MANTLKIDGVAQAGTTKTWRLSPRGDSVGVFLYVKYTLGDGTSCLLTCTVINPLISSSVEYAHEFYFDTDMVTVLQAGYKFTASLNLVVPVIIRPEENQLKITAAFTGGATQELDLTLRH